MLSERAEGKLRLAISYTLNQSPLAARCKTGGFFVFACALRYGES